METVPDTTVLKSRKASGLSESLHKIVQKVGARGGGIYIPDFEKKELNLIVHENRPAHFLASLKWGEGVCGYLAESEKDHFIVDDYNAFDRRPKKFPSNEFRSILGMAIKDGSRVLAFLFVEGPQVGQFNAHHAVMLRNDVNKLRDYFVSEVVDFTHLAELGNLKGLIAKAPMGIITVENGKIKIFNWKAADMFGYSFGEVWKIHVKELYKDRNEAKRIGDLLDKNMVIKSEDAVCKNKQGEQFPIRVTAAKLREGPNSVGFIEDRREFQKEQKHRQFLQECTDLFSSTKPFETVLDDLERMLRDKFGADFCGIYFKDERRPKLRIWQKIYGLPEELDQNVLVPVGNTFLTQSLTPRTRGDSQILDAFDWETKTCLLIAPFEGEENEPGLICLKKINEDGKDQFEEKCRNLIRAVAQQTGIHIARHHMREREKRAKLWLEAFFDASMVLVDVTDPDEIYNRMAELVCGAFEAAWVSVLVLDRQKVVQGRGRFGCDLDLPVRPGGLTHEILDSGEPIILNNVRDGSKNVSMDVTSEGVKAVLGVPLKDHGRTFGVIWCHFKEYRTFLDFELKTLQSYAHQGATLLKRLQTRKVEKALVDGINALEQAKDVPAILKTLTTQIHEILDIRTHACLYDRANKTPDTVWPEDSDQTWIYEQEQAINLTDSNHGFRLRINPRWDCMINLIEEQTKNLDSHEWGFIERLLSGTTTALRRLRLDNRHEEWLLVAKGAVDAVKLPSKEKAIPQILKTIAASFRCYAVSVIFFQGEQLVHASLIGETNAWQTGTDEEFGALLGYAQLKTVQSCEEGQTIPWNFKPKSLAVLPLREQDSQIGVLWLGFKKHRLFSAEHKANLHLLGDMVSLSIRLSRQNERIQLQYAGLESLRGAGQAVIASLDMDFVLQEIVNRAAQLEDSKNESCSADIWLVDKAKGTFIHKAVSDIGTTILQDWPIPTKGKIQGIVGRCCLEGTTQNIPNIGNDDAYLEHRTLTKSELAVPIKKGDEVIGVLNLERRCTGMFDQDQVVVVEVLAYLASIAILTAQQYEDLKEIRGLVGNQTVREFIQLLGGTWEHNLIREVGGIRAKLLRIKKRVRGDEELLGLIAKAYSALENISKISKIVPLTPGEQMEPMDLQELVLSHFRAVWRDGFSHVKLQLPKEQKPVIVQAGRNWLKRLFEILTNNAIRAMESKNGAMEFSVSMDVNENHVTLKFRDTGPGIPPNLVDKLFNSPIKHEEGAKGMGIGLMLAESMVKAYNGKIWLGSSNSSGAEFCLRFPLYKEKY